MKTIEQAAIEFAALTNGMVDIDRKLGFEAGVAFAQRWISVSAELPPLNTRVLLRDSLIDANAVGLYSGNRFYSDNDQLTEITYWRPI